MLNAGIHDRLGRWYFPPPTPHDLMDTAARHLHEGGYRFLEMVAPLLLDHPD